MLAAVAEYRKTVRRFAKMPNLAVWYASLDLERALAELQPKAADRARAQARLQKARSKDSVARCAKLTERVDGHARFRGDPPLLVPLADLLPPQQADATRAYLTGIVEGYRDSLAGDRHRLLDQFSLVDIARKVVGVGSVGTRAWVLLLTGRDDADPLVLQAKEARPSVLERYCGASVFDNAGQRVVEGQRVVQASSDIFLGWVRVSGLDGLPRDFYVRQLWDGKASADIETMQPRHLRLYGALCAWTLARAHCPFRRPGGDRVVPGEEGHVRARHRRLRRRLRRPRRGPAPAASHRRRQRCRGCGWVSAPSTARARPDGWSGAGRRRASPAW